MPDNIKPVNTVEASKHLWDKWRYKISPHTLETYRSRCGGPEHFGIGRNVLYSPVDLDAWVLSRMTPKVSSASEAREIRLARRKLIQDDPKPRKVTPTKSKLRKPAHIDSEDRKP
jgi:hypothetical protein